MPFDGAGTGVRHTSPSLKPAPPSPSVLTLGPVLPWIRREPGPRLHGCICSKDLALGGRNLEGPLENWVRVSRLLLLGGR